MVSVRALACDECGSLDGVTRWRIVHRGRSTYKDLCVLHDRELVKLTQEATEQAGRADFKITTPEELEALKRQKAPRSARNVGL